MTNMPLLRKPNESRTIAVVGDVYRFLATGDDTNGKYALLSRSLLSKRFSNFFHPPAVHTQVGFANPGFRAKVDEIRLPVDHKLNIISKAKDQAGRFSVKVAFCFRDDLHARDDGENCFEFPHSIFWGPVKRDCLNRVLAIRVLGRNAIR